MWVQAAEGNPCLTIVLAPNDGPREIWASDTGARLWTLFAEASPSSSFKLLWIPSSIFASPEPCMSCPARSRVEILSFGKLNAERCVQVRLGLSHNDMINGTWSLNNKY